MTTLIVWVGVDSRGPTSMYLASDSRFTWEGGVKWDFGCKVFASRKHPTLLGYCGDVTLSSISITQALDLIDSNSLFRADASSEEKLDWLYGFLKRAFETYPKSLRREFTVVFAFRSTNNNVVSFFAGTVGWSPGEGWSKKPLPDPQKSSIIGAFGSGKDVFGDTNRRWQESDVGGTSRAIFSAFCDHVDKCNDPQTGGAPQLGAIYSGRQHASTVGIIHDGKKWLSGVEVLDAGIVDKIEWRDNLFQRCDGHTLKPIAGAQRHARPF
jgi:hypothetical protein